MANSNHDLMMRRGGQAIDKMAQQSGRDTSNLYASSREAAADAAQGASDAARGFTRSASDAYERAADVAGDTYRDARRFAGDAYQGAAGMVQDTAYAMQRRATSFDEALGEQLSRNPVTALVLAVGVGFVLGAWYASNGRAFTR